MSSLFVLMIRRTPRSTRTDTLFPYTTLFRSLADALVVTSDSVNMASEACATGKPVYIADIEPESGRLAAFHEGLRRTGHTRRFAGRVDAWSHPPMAEAPRIGEILPRRLAEHGRSEERRVGEERVSTGGSQWSRCIKKKHTN